MLQREAGCRLGLLHRLVSNPISGEVGAAACFGLSARTGDFRCFKPHQRGGGCCSCMNCYLNGQQFCIVSNPISGEVGAAAWGLPEDDLVAPGSFKPHQRGGGCCSCRGFRPSWLCPQVSNPISGEVGAAALLRQGAELNEAAEVSNPISGEVGAAASGGLEWVNGVLVRFQTPSAGRWELQLVRVHDQWFRFTQTFQTPSAGRWVLQRGGDRHRQRLVRQVSNPISGEVGAAAVHGLLHHRRTRLVSNPISGEVGAAAGPG